MNCSICLEEIKTSISQKSKKKFKKRKQIIITQTNCCHNYFHQKCLKQWFQSQHKYQSGIGSCPLCRRLSVDDYDFEHHPSFVTILLYNMMGRPLRV